MSRNDIDAALLSDEMSRNGDIDTNTLTFLFALVAVDHAQGEEVAREAENPTDFDHYEGQTKNGQAHGSGKMIWRSGDKYEGNFSKGSPQGKGVYTYANGDKFTGKFADLKRNGVCTYANGDVYTGELNNLGQRDGLGLLELKNGDKYFGDWKYGKEDGMGVLIESGSKRIYTGQWRHGKKHGDGKTMYANGDKHEGKYINGKPGKPTKWGTTSDSQGIEEEVRVLKEALLVMEQQAEEYENQIRMLKDKNPEARSRVRQSVTPKKPIDIEATIGQLGTGRKSDSFAQTQKSKGTRATIVTPTSKSKKDGKRKNEKEVINFFDDLLKK